jgi:hypothetical protein
MIRLRERHAARSRSQPPRWTVSPACVRRPRNWKLPLRARGPALAPAPVGSGSKRAANVGNRLRSTMRSHIKRRPESRMNRAIARPSSPIVVTVEPACHAGGRGFESRSFGRRRLQFPPQTRRTRASASASIRLRRFGTARRPPYRSGRGRRARSSTFRPRATTGSCRRRSCLRTNRFLPGRSAPLRSGASSRSRCAAERGQARDTPVAQPNAARREIQDVDPVRTAVGILDAPAGAVDLEHPPTSGRRLAGLRLCYLAHPARAAELARRRGGGQHTCNSCL